MDSPYILYFIVTLAMLLYFVFCIATTWFFAKLVLSIIPGGKNNDNNKKDQEVNEVPKRGDG